MSCSEWKEYRLDEVGDIVSGGTPSTKNEDYYGNEIPWITPKDLSGYDSKYISKGERSITKLGLEKSSAKLLPKGTILFSSRAPIGYVAIAQEDLCTNQGFKNIVCNPQVAHNEFIYYRMKLAKEELESVAGGSTFKEVDTERDNVLNILNELVPTFKDLKAYDDSKAYMNDGGAKGKELAAKYVAQVEKFDAAYAKFNDALNKANTEQTKKQIEKLKKDGKKGYAAAMESTLRLTTLVENVEKAPKNADKQAVEKELNEIQTLLKSINNDRGEVLVNSYNSVVGSVRQVLTDANENNLNEMIENFNNYIESYNNTTPDQFDSK